MGILVTGANGQLGRELRRLVRERNLDGWFFSDVNVLPGEETLYLDVTDRAAVTALIRSLKPSVVINCAGFTDVEKAESEKSLNSLLNAEAPAILADAASRAGAGLVHISSDFVFPGDGNMPLKEDDPKGPLNEYGAAKLKGEEALLASSCKVLIIRTAWLYSPNGRNFVKTILELCPRRDTLTVVDDQTGSPTYAGDLAAFLIFLTGTGSLPGTGVFHFTGEGAVSRYDLACAIRDLSGSSCVILPCRSEDYPSKALRPAFSALDCGKTSRTFGVSPRPWRESLAECISRMK